MPPTKDINSEIKGCFKKLDQDGNGRICKKELGTLFKAVFGMPPNVELPDSLLTAIMKEADKDNSGFISEDELQGAAVIIAQLRIAMELNEVFNALDKDKNGFLTKEELQVFAEGNAQGEQKKMMGEAISKYPNDMKISREEFIKNCFAQMSHKH